MGEKRFSSEDDFKQDAQWWQSSMGVLKMYQTILSFLFLKNIPRKRITYKMRIDYKATCFGLCKKSNILIDFVNTNSENIVLMSENCDYYKQLKCQI